MIIEREREREREIERKNDRRSQVSPKLMIDVVVVKFKMVSY